MDTNTDYTACLNKLGEIEIALNQIDAGLIEQLALELDQCLASLKEMEGDHRNARPRADHGKEHLPVAADICEALLKKNSLLTHRVRSIMALQRSELDKLKLGRETAKGYAACRPARTGALINSSN